MPALQFIVFLKDCIVWDFTMWPLTVLTGFYYKEIYGRFAGTKKSGRNNEVAVLTRWP